MNNKLPRHLNINVTHEMSAPRGCAQCSKLKTKKTASDRHSSKQKEAVENS